MDKLNYLQLFQSLLTDVQELKKLQLQVLYNLENPKETISETQNLTEEWITVKVTCKILGCSEVTLWKLRKKGILSYSRLGRSIRFKKCDVLNYLNQKIIL